MPTSADGNSNERHERTVPRERRPKMTLMLQNPSRSGGVPPLAMLRRWACAALATSAEVTVRVVSAAEFEWKLT